MNIVITGAGEVGRHLAGSLSNRDHNLTIIEAQEALARDLDEQLNSHVLCGDGTTVTTLAEANVAEADLFLALTSDRNVNLVSASLAKAMGARWTIARVDASVQREEWLFDYRSHFRIDYLFSVERLTAIEIAKHIRNPNRLLVEEFARGRIELVQCGLAPESGLCGRSLLEIKLPPQVRVALIQRGGESRVPAAKDPLEAGDVVTLFGEPNILAEVLPRFDPGIKPRSEVKIVIFGGDKYGAVLAQMLEAKRHFKVRIMESSRQRCEQLAAQMQNTTIINGDGTSLQQLKEEQVGEADFFIGMSHQDEDNVMTCLQARALGAGRCLALVHRADYADVISSNEERLGIHAAVSPRVAVSRDLMRFITSDPYHSVMSLHGGVEILELTLAPDSPVRDLKLSEISWPPGSGLVALLHEQQAVVPGGNDVLRAGDTVYAVTTPEARRPFIRLMTH
ncbi:MAG TPA: Trk system potassium transporter TrkA [Verrucomicrobiales bacterium]|nr:Trk system potassium transporter TrkA [Verrucomicrobiales bacterium]